MPNWLMLLDEKLGLLPSAVSLRARPSPPLPPLPSDSEREGQYDAAHAWKAITEGTVKAVMWMCLSKPRTLLFCCITPAELASRFSICRISFLSNHHLRR